MPSSTPDWSALASKHEKVMDGRAAEGSPDPVPAGQHPAGQPGRHRAAAGPVRRPRWRGRGSRAAAAATAAALTVTGAASVSASAATSSSLAWHIVKQVHSGEFGQFSAVVAVGKTGGWAFNGITKPTAWRRNGSTWTRVAFPGKPNETVVAAKASSPTNVWAFTAGNGSRALHWNGSQWTVARSFSQQIGGAVVLNRDDVWVFGQPIFPGNGLGTWHFNGHVWTHVSSGAGLQGGSALSASSIWAFGGNKVAHWNGHTWTRTSVAGLLPVKIKPTGLNNPSVTAIYAQSANNIWAIGNGEDEDDGGPLVVLHYNGHRWSRVARSITLGGDGVLGQVAPDGARGLWFPMPTAQGGGKSYIVHYSNGHLTAAALPVAATKINIQSIAAIPGTARALAGGFTHGANGSNVVSVILQLTS
jgi:hypothetical protein